LSGRTKMTFNQTWSMAVGGMVGGGIFSTLGVVIAIAGGWAWLSFAAAGLIALAAGYSYAKLALHYDEGGGVYIYLRNIGAKHLAGSLVWILIIGYVLTNAVYAFTFGEYLAHVVDEDPWFARTAAVAIMAVFIGLNLRGVGEASWVEVILVWFKLLVLVVLAGCGLAQWEPEMLSRGVPDSGILIALFGAASVFMAYEGFQLLAYDYEDINNPRQTLPRAMLWAIAVVIFIYIMVALGTAMLIGADAVVAHEEVALAIAGQQAFGTAGLFVVTLGAAFSTGSAINSTLFATARLSKQVADHGDLPSAIRHRNAQGIPDRAVLTLGGLAALLAALGTLTALVEAASLAFLFTFSVVCVLAFTARAGSRWITGFGSAAAAAATITLTIKLANEDPLPLAGLVLLALISLFGRRLINGSR